jgi:integrase
MAPTTIKPSGESRNSPFRFVCVNEEKGANILMENQKEKRASGTGSIFLNGSNTWWIKFSDRGIAYRESSFSTDHKVAEKLLALRLAELKTDKFTPRTNVRVDELVNDLLSEYREKQQESIDSVEQRWRLHLKPFFTKRKAADVTTDMIRRYIAGRVKELAEPATINRELAILKRAFNLAMESTPTKVRIVPYIPMFTEKNRRKGFLKDEEYSKLVAECGKQLWLRSMLAVAYNYGWRAGEVLGLRVSQVDLADRTIRLEVGTTKNDEGRTVKMTKEVFPLLSACVIGKKQDDPLFTRDDGTPVLDFRNVWHGVCVRAGVSGQNGASRFVCSKCEKTMTKRKCECGSRRRKYDGLLFHDLRRTGVRNLRRLGVAESVAMKISGHKTASIFRRYDIIEHADLADAAARLDAKQESQAVPEFFFGQSLDRAKPKTVHSDHSEAAPLPAQLPN